MSRMLLDVLSHYVNPHSVRMPLIMDLPASRWAARVDLNLLLGPLVSCPSLGCLWCVSLRGSAGSWQRASPVAVFTWLLWERSQGAELWTRRKFRLWGKQKGRRAPRISSISPLSACLRSHVSSCNPSSASLLSVSYLACSPPLSVFSLHLKHLSSLTARTRLIDKLTCGKAALMIRQRSFLSYSITSFLFPFSSLPSFPSDLEMNHVRERGKSVMADEECQASRGKEWMDDLTGVCSLNFGDVNSAMELTFHPALLEGLHLICLCS